MAVVVKLFILGLPGCGKSAMARHIINYVNCQPVDEDKHQLWSAIRFNDYTILDGMFHQDTTKRFRPAKPGGFDVLDLKVFDEALQKLELDVNSYINALEQNAKELLIIEFSRNDYNHAFQQFNKLFLKNAYFLYLDTELEKCKQRIHHRSTNPKYKDDDYPVSEYIFERYYCADNWMLTVGSLAKDFGVVMECVWTFNNNLPEETACMEVEPYIKKIILGCASQIGLDKRTDSLEELTPDKQVDDEFLNSTLEKEAAIYKENFAAIGF